MPWEWLIKFKIGRLAFLVPNKEHFQDKTGWAIGWKSYDCYWSAWKTFNIPRIRFEWNSRKMQRGSAFSEFVGDRFEYWKCLGFGFFIFIESRKSGI